MHTEKTNYTEQKNLCNHILLVASVLSCFILGVLFILFGIVMGVALVSLDGVEFLIKVVFISFVVALLLSLIILSYILVKKFLAMRVIFIVFSIFSVIFSLVYYDVFWYNVYTVMTEVLVLVFRLT